MSSESGPPTEKRNSGRCGPTSPEGKAASSQNARKHGACAKTLILPGESEDEWLLLYARWSAKYQPAEDSLEADFVLKVAQAEWHRIRAQHAYDHFLDSIGAIPPHAWHPGEAKRHDLSLRYKTAAERTFQREYRLLEQHIKTHRSKTAPPASIPPPYPIPPPPAEPFSGSGFEVGVSVTIVDGQTKAKFYPSNDLTLKWVGERAKPGDWIRRSFTFKHGVPPEFEWMFPDPAARVTNAKFDQTMTCGEWLRLYVAEQLHPSGLPLDYTPFIQYPAPAPSPPPPEPGAEPRV